MIRPAIKKIIEEIGFKLIGNEYTANFVCDATGNVLSCVVKECEDRWGLATIRFHFFNSDGDFLSESSLDQMLVSIYDRHITLVPIKSDKEYEIVFLLHMKVDVDMKNVSDKDYLDGMEAIDNETEHEVATYIAMSKLKEIMDENSLTADKFMLLRRKEKGCETICE